MLSRLSASFFKAHNFLTAPARGLHQELLTQIPEGASLSRLKNDIRAEESVSDYMGRSWREFTQGLRPNHFYIFVARATLTDKLFPGRVASFLTNEEGIIILDSCMSLRPGIRVEGEELHSILEHDPKKEHRKFDIFTIRFFSFEEEIKTYFLQSAKHVASSEGRFLFRLPNTKLPTAAEDLVLAVKGFKAQYAEKKYILCDGEIVNKKGGRLFAKALNCVNGFYGAVGVEGKQLNPSPQMAISGYLRLLFGVTGRNDLLKGTGFRGAGELRTGDDHVNWLRKRKFSTAISSFSKSYTPFDKITNSYLRIYSEPDNPEVRYYEGIGHFADGRYEEAVYAFSISAKNSLYAPWSLKKIAEVYETLGSSGDAKEYTEKANLALAQIKEAGQASEFEQLSKMLEPYDGIVKEGVASRKRFQP